MIKDGIININKPAGMTSHDCIYVMRRLTGIKRIGHTGTLDPNATGVLPVCIGASARVTEYLDMDYKTYRCELLLGMRTDTQDVWGTVITNDRQTLLEQVVDISANKHQKHGFLFDNKTKEKHDIIENFSTESDIGIEIEKDFVSRDKIIKAFSHFDGVIEQIPPKYSAVRVDGRRLYEYARDGIDVDIKSRKVFLKDLKIEEIDMENLRVVFKVTCTKGTYIRTICSDVGEMLGVGAVMSSLVRLASGVFDISEAVDLEYLRKLKNEKEALLNELKSLCKSEIDEQDTQKCDNMSADTLQSNKRLAEIEEEISSYIKDTDIALGNFGTAVIKTSERAKWFINGGHIKMHEVEITKPPRYESEDFPLEIREEYRKAYNLYEPEEKRFLGVAFYNTKYKCLVADKVFSRN